MKWRRFTLAASLVVAMVVAFAPRPALAGWACITAEKFGGSCDVCNALCSIEVFFDALGGW